MTTCNMPCFHETYKLIYFLQIIIDAVAVNVAFNKSTGYCSRDPSLNKMTDGDKSLSNFETFTGPCITVSFVQIHLGAKYNMHYVIIFEGEGNHKGQLDFFVVRLTDVKGDAQMCSEYPGTLGSERNDRGLRVNCGSLNDLYSDVLIESRKNIGFTITEIEVYTFAIGPNEKALIHIGCFYKFGDNDVFHHLKGCQYTCLKGGFMFAGMKDRQMCTCSNDIDRTYELPMHHCNFKCQDGVKYCGGDNSYSVYLIKSPLPFYEGCLKTHADFTDGAVKSGNMTITECLHLCENRRYALLQNGDHCICEDAISRTAILPRRHVYCTLSCTGSPNLVCGGETMASLYSTCRPGEKSDLTCSKLFNCVNSYDMFGSCQGECKQGYVDEHCLEQVDSCVTSNPCLNLSNAYCTIYKGIALCECDNGYERLSDEKCEDIDECQQDSCDTRTSTCINFNGSFACFCNIGFREAGENICIANKTYNLDYRYYIAVLKRVLFYTLPIFCVLGFVLMIWGVTPKKTDSSSFSSSLGGYSKTPNPWSKSNVNTKVSVATERKGRW